MYITNIVKWCAYGFYRLNFYLKVRTEVTQSLGKILTIRKPTKHNINTRIFTKVELVAVDDIMLHTIWESYFYISKDKSSNEP